MVWKVCEVTAAGPIENGSVYIALKGINETTGVVEFENWFRAFPSMQKEMLATALCALSTGKRVLAGLPDNLAPESVIERLYLRQWMPPP
jgi:hypothetical protein